MISYEEVSALFHTRKAPTGLIAHLVEYPGGDQPPEYFAIRMYRSNFDKLTNMDRFASINWAQETLQTINYLVPISLEVWRAPGVPE